MFIYDAISVVLIGIEYTKSTYFFSDFKINLVIAFSDES